MTRSIIDIADMDCTKPSPCRSCHWHIQGIEKNRCVKICQRLSAYRDGLEYNHLPWPELKDLQDVEEVEICEICRLEGKETPARVRGLCQAHYARWQHGRVNHPKLGSYKRKTEDKIPPKNEKHKVKSNDTLQKKKKTGDNSMPEVEKVSVKRNEDDLAKNQKPACIIPGCDKPAKLRGLCQTDYDKWRNGTIDHPEFGQYSRSNVRAEKGICLIEGCNVIANVRGLCSSHYQAFRKGTIEHPIQGKFAVSQVHHKSKTKTDATKLSTSHGQGLMAKATWQGKEIPITYPFPDIVPLDFTNYPEIKAVIFDTAQKLLLPAEHVAVSLISEGIVAKMKKP